MAQMEEERRDHVSKMKKMEQEMQQVFEMKVKEKLQKLQESEAEVRPATVHLSVSEPHLTSRPLTSLVAAAATRADEEELGGAAQGAGGETAPSRGGAGLLGYSAPLPRAAETRSLQVGAVYTLVGWMDG